MNRRDDTLKLKVGRRSNSSNSHILLQGESVH